MGQTIRQLRLDRQLTLEQAAERAGCTPGFLSQVERNQAVPSITMLYAIAKALGVEVTHFFPRMSSVAKVVRAGERETFRFEGSFIAYYLEKIIYLRAPQWLLVAAVVVLLIVTVYLYFLRPRPVTMSGRESNRGSYQDSV